jgi:hypothetical protein
MPDHDSDALALLVQLRLDYPGWRVTRAGTSTWIATADTSPTASRTIAAHDLERLAERLADLRSEAEGVTWLPSRH